LIRLLLVRKGYGFAPVICFRGFDLGVEEDELAIAATLLGMLTIPNVGEVMLHRSQKKRSKLSPATFGMQVSLVRKKIGEKALNEILRVGRRVASPTDEAVERRPIIATEPGESSV
jgi:hypothetical protein